ncbi:hypothetical protein COY05_01685 [Candidatus Peregrinibacteria bacterium CG_4_10_14_0_2_um_filter_38_24]|nr:hypothetical protein [Candidatus Peregrinibacteria bacterium]PIZ76254.1 MAG: hypothetical protein COY05_01685 [Candidatus Peregrinibacteria bacterium CG_4_10_14_0_2_um_filter_38_24]PJC39117.1 MAG: hypothetical protein CO044_01410 [Candidatus Peregrinibacteria bacterium CG_4_9_14_0_2_um_filter_38_9]
MTIVLSWDLFVLVFFVVIVAYSFIVGRDSTLKIILGTYVSMIAADAGGTVFSQYFGGSVMFMKLLKLAAVGNEQEAMVLVKVVIFIAFVIIFAVKGAFEVDTVDDRSAAVRFVLSILYAIMSAGLIISAILVFVSGISFIGAGEPKTTITALWDVYNESSLIRSIVNNSALWFSLPALAFLVHSLYTKKE